MFVLSTKNEISQNDISFARIPLATACPGSPFDILRAVSSAEASRPVAGELRYRKKSSGSKITGRHFANILVDFFEQI